MFKPVLRLKDVQNIQFVFSFFIGWFLLGNLWNIKMRYSVKTSGSYVACDVNSVISLAIV